MTKTFSAQVDDFIEKSEARMLAVAQTATQSVIDDAQTSVAKGGRMRVVTGFLRNSGQASLNGLPVGPSRPVEGVPGEEDAKLVIGKAKLGDDLWFGWTANYARARESKDAFLGIAVQRWQIYVNKAVAKAKRLLR